MTTSERPARDSHVPLPPLVQTLSLPAPSPLAQTLRFDQAPEPVTQFARFDAIDDAVTSFLPIEQLRAELGSADGPSTDAATARPWQEDDERMPSNVLERRGVIASWRKSSGVTRACLLLLPLIALVWGLPRFRERFRQREFDTAAASPSAPSAPAAPSPAAAPSEAPPPERAAAVDVPVEPAQPALPPKLERAAADRIAAGDPKAALALYRDLAARQPDNAAFREAVRILAMSEVTP